MANEVNPKARQAFAEAAINWLTSDIKVVLLDASYTKAPADEFLDDLPGGAIVATSGNLAGKTTTDGYCDASNIQVNAVAGDDISQMWVYKDTGVAGTSRLITYFDTAATAALINYEPTGGDIVIRWSAAGIFRL